MSTGLLTPRERFGLLVIDEPQDRVPVFPLVTVHACRVAGIMVREYVTDGVALARAQLAAQERYGHDFIAVFTEVGIIAEALGSRFEFPEDDLPFLDRPLWRDPGEADDRVTVPERDGRLPVYLDAVRYAWEARGDRVPVLVFIPASFTTAQQLVDTEALLLGLLAAPAAIHRVLDCATRSVIALCRSVIRAGGLPVLVDPLASASVISPGHYREFALPATRAVVEYLHRWDLDTVLHVCGETEPILAAMADTGADLLSLDRVDLARAIADVGDRCRIIGNYGTTDIWLSPPADIEAGAAAMVGVGRACPAGFVAATGCEVPLETPAANVEAFIRAARDAGLNPAFGRAER
jgi:uroporphyrinogen decarboxylase